ncbi:MAG: metallophosphoesterase, partial [Desulfovibrionaceae bacterium]|nr:metallophosphoesterase [Desulfovibrionaceae bacterium]
VLYIIGLASLFLSGIGVWQAVKVPDVRRVEIYLSRLPEELDGLRIALLADVHASSLLEREWVEQVVSKTNGLKPDLIVISGDIVDGLVKDRQEDVAPLARLSAPLGVYAVNGNHEYYSDYIGWMNKFPELNLKMLLNAHTVISRDGAKLVLAGITDRAAERFSLPGPDLNLALADAPAEAPVILLEHQPSGAVRNSEAGVDLQLSGHTHGGQFVGLRILSQWVNKGFISGLYQVGSMQLYVSNGTGLWSGLPVRVGVPSEITEITLRCIP